MTNREKYHFDDFTLDNYQRLLRLAKKQGFEFILHKDDFVPERKDIIWRHDVEFEPDIALIMAQLEAEEGIKGSYFFQLHSPYYNLFDQHYTVLFHKIHQLGHHVGLHFDCRYWDISDEAQLDEFITLDRNYMQRALGVIIDTFSFHNTTPFTQSCLQYRYGGLVNVYSSFFKEHYNYCGDSLGYWRFDRLEDVLRDDNVRHLQVLTHDANWSDEVLSPRKRFAKAMHAHAERLVQGQVNGLHNRGMLCPDDDEE
ncbi:MAG: hypothetical protein J6O49_13925 [Bacteroidaceae bacterium]|nr:hypothetical protein [Bacteroidaceae bacterium]